MTRAEAVREYADALTGTSAEQAVALERFCNELEHIGFLRGYEQGSRNTTFLFDAVLGASRRESA